MPLQRYLLPSQDPCWGVISQQVVQVGIYDSSRIMTTSRLAGTGHHLSGSDEGSTPNPPVHVERPFVQPQLNKQRQWIHNQNKEVMYCYYMATKEKQRGYRKRMYETLQSRENF